MKFRFRKRKKYIKPEIKIGYLFKEYDIEGRPIYVYYNRYKRLTIIKYYDWRDEKWNSHLINIYLQERYCN